MFNEYRPPLWPAPRGLGGPLTPEHPVRDRRRLGAGCGGVRDQVGPHAGLRPRRARGPAVQPRLHPERLVCTVARHPPHRPTPRDSHCGCGRRADGRRLLARDVNLLTPEPRRHGLHAAVQTVVKSCSYNLATLRLSAGGSGGNTASPLPAPGVRARTRGPRTRFAAGRMIRCRYHAETPRKSQAAL